MADVERIPKDIDELVEWSRIWLLNFNAGKCKVMHAGARNGTYGRANYFMEGIEIQAVTEEKDLGVVVDDKLRFSRHIAAAAACANRKLGLLKHTFNFKYWTESLVTLFKVFVQPHLEYCIGCIQAGTPTLRRDIETLEKVQRRATKLVPSLRNLPYEDRLRRLNLPTLEERRIGDISETFKILKQHDQVDPHNFFITREDTIARENTRGHHLKIFKQRRNTVQRRKFFSHRVVDHGRNDLPREVIEATTVNGFKGRLDKYIERERQEL